MQRPGNLNGGSSWFGEFSGRGRGRSRAKGKAMGMRKGMKRGAKKIAKVTPGKCGWWCRMKRRMKGLPPIPVVVEEVVVEETVTPEQIVEDTTGVDPSMGGYFGGWTYF